MTRYTEALRAVTRLQNELLDAERELNDARREEAQL